MAKYCNWFYNVSQPEQFVGLLFSIGFLGIREGKQWFYKSSAGEDVAAPPLSSSTIISVHPAYHAALHLRSMVLPELTTDTILKSTGILEDLPQGVSFDDYHQNLKQLLDKLDNIQRGKDGAGEFEDFVGDVIKLCFFRSLTNPQPKVRDIHGVTIKDWVVSNRAPSGFWEVIRSKYAAVQVVWECKNYDHLSADDFQQTAYYMNNVSGRFVVIAYRADEVDQSNYRHVERIAKDGGMVLLLTERDLRVFIRQAIRGKVREDHISELFDRTLRAIS
jgi:hypothetical protein